MTGDVLLLDENGGKGLDGPSGNHAGAPSGLSHSSVSQAEPLIGRRGSGL
jgi:hypothetical protein